MVSEDGFLVCLEQLRNNALAAFREAFFCFLARMMFEGIHHFLLGVGDATVGDGDGLGFSGLLTIDVILNSTVGGQLAIQIEHWNVPIGWKLTFSSRKGSVFSVPSAVCVFRRR